MLFPFPRCPLCFYFVLFLFLERKASRELKFKFLLIIISANNKARTVFRMIEARELSLFSYHPYTNVHKYTVCYQDWDIA